MCKLSANDVWIKLYCIFDEMLTHLNVGFQITTTLVVCIAVFLIICVTRVAKAALEKALAENEDIDDILSIPELPTVADSAARLDQPLIIKIDSAQDNHEK